MIRYLTVQTNGSFTFSATDTQSGSYNYVLLDFAGNSTTGTLIWNVVAPPASNSAPTATSDDLGNVQQGQSVTGPLFTNDSDPDNDALTTDYFSGHVSGGYLTVQTNGSFKVTAASPIVGSYTYTLRDSFGHVATATLSWNVVASPPTNAAPNAGNDDLGNIDIGQSVSGSLFTNDSDADNDALSTDPFSGTVGGGYLVVQTDGTYTFTALAPAAGSNSYVLRDSQGNNASATLYWNVTAPPPANSAPYASDDDLGNLVPGQTVSGEHQLLRWPRGSRLSKSATIWMANLLFDHESVPAWPKVRR